MPCARAGFELQLDADSVIAVGNQYTIDVRLINNGSDTKLRGLFAAVAATKPGLTFQGISVPEDAVFGNTFNYSSDKIPASGDQEVPWGAYITLQRGKEPIQVATGVAFQLNFSVAGNGDFGPRFVEFDEDQVYMTGYTVAGATTEDGVATGFHKLHSADIKIASTPEPSTIALFVAAAGGVGLWRRRQRVVAAT